jgi:hypothetical protein
MRLRHRSTVKVIGVCFGIAAFVAFFKYSTDHPTVRSIADHVIRDARSHRMPPQQQQAAKPHWATEDTQYAKSHSLASDGRLLLSVGYDDGYFQAGWREVTDIDLDLPTGRLAFTSTSGTTDVVAMPINRYRLGVSGRSAHELEQGRERFRIDLWPRRADRPMHVLNRAD